MLIFLSVLKKAAKNTKKIVISEELIVKTAQSTLEIEIETLKALTISLNKEFVACVKAIFLSTGRLVVTGVGKSAIVAQKIVATLNSTGTPSLFMHAADAIHGDLGMIRADDFVLCISKSGETAEIKALAPLAKSLCSTLIGMVSNRDSFLGKQATYVLHTPIPKEADPNNLAPTASTTAQMAMGDALATALLALRGFTPVQFAQFHPGGALGKQLYLRVSDLYPNNEQPQVHEEEDLPNTLLEMTAKRLGATAVLDEKGRLQGVITDGDLRRMLSRGADFSKLRAKDMMNRTPKTILSDAMAVQALEMLRQHSISQLIVTDEENNYLGIIHLHDLIREGII